MRIIVNDSSALIDLKKGGLLEIFLRLPFELVVSVDMLADELSSFTRDETALMRRTMTTVTLDESETERADSLQRTSPALTGYDCAVIIIAQRDSESVILTGDRRLRTKAESVQIECHGVLWAVDEIAKAKLATARTLIKALETWRGDTLVRIPAEEISKSLAKLKAK